MSVERDIGCGCAALRIELHISELPNLQRFQDNLQQAVPVGACHWDDQRRMPLLNAAYWRSLLQQEFGWLTEQYKDEDFDATYAVSCLGTLGKGNHAIEVCSDQNDKVWFLVHAGSSDTGNIVSKHHNGLAWRAPMKRAVEWLNLYAQKGRTCITHQMLNALAASYDNVVPIKQESYVDRCHDDLDCGCKNPNKDSEFVPADLIPSAYKLRRIISVQGCL